MNLRLRTVVLASALVALAPGVLARDASASRPRAGRIPRAKMHRSAPKAPHRPRVARKPIRTATRMVARRRMQGTLARADHQSGIRQLTGRGLAVGQRAFPFRMPADPFVYETADGRVQVYGTSEQYLEWRSLDDFLRGAPFAVERLPGDTDVVASWDQNIERWPDGNEVLYGGVMTPTEGREHARWPEENWNRRIYAFVRTAAGWMRRKQPLFNPIAPGTRPHMIGHSYGHHFKTIDRVVRGRRVRETWVFHEEIVAENPMRTEMFARRMIDPYTASEDKVKVLGTEWEGHPIGQRAHGNDLLVEGPRPFTATLRGEPYHFVSFSSGDFASDNYDIHFAWRKGDAIGPYTPYVDREGDRLRLRGFAQQLKERYALSWVGRAHVIQDRGGRFWAVFHAVDKTIRPEVDYTRNASDLHSFQRNIYAVPMTIEPGAGGEPRIKLHDMPRGRRGSPSRGTP